MVMPTAILDGEISAVRFFAVCCGRMIHPTAKWPEEVNRKCHPRNTMVQLSTYTLTLSVTMHSTGCAVLETDGQMDIQTTVWCQ